METGRSDKQEAHVSGEDSAQQPEMRQADAGSAFEQLAAEAQAGGAEEEVGARVQRALACPCVAELKEGPCGAAFVDAFTCFLMSPAEEQGSDCIQQFVAMQTCIEAHPGAFADKAEQELASQSQS